MLTLILTNSQRMALADILTAYLALDEPQQFRDSATGDVTTAGELLRMVVELGGTPQRQGSSG